MVWIASTKLTSTRHKVCTRAVQGWLAEVDVARDDLEATKTTGGIFIGEGCLHSCGCCLTPCLDRFALEMSGKKDGGAGISCSFSAPALCVSCCTTTVGPFKVVNCQRMTQHHIL